MSFNLIKKNSSSIIKIAHIRGSSHTSDIIDSHYARDRKKRTCHQQEQIFMQPTRAQDMELEQYALSRNAVNKLSKCTNKNNKIPSITFA